MIDPTMIGGKRCRGGRRSRRVVCPDVRGRPHQPYPPVLRDRLEWSDRLGVVGWVTPCQRGRAATRYMLNAARVAWVGGRRGAARPRLDARRSSLPARRIIAAVSPTLLLVIYCAVAVAASVLGGLVPLVVKLTHRRMQLLSSGVAGFMLGVAVLVLLPHALRAMPIASAGPWLLGGLLTMFFLERFFCYHHHDVPAEVEIGPGDDDPVAHLARQQREVAEHDTVVERHPHGSSHEGCGQDHSGTTPHTGHAAALGRGGGGADAALADRRRGAGGGGGSGGGRGGGDRARRSGGA